jgi:hypothetical protein
MEFGTFRILMMLAAKYIVASDRRNPRLSSGHYVSRDADRNHTVISKRNGDIHVPNQHLLSRTMI